MTHDLLQPSPDTTYPDALSDLNLSNSRHAVQLHCSNNVQQTGVTHTAAVLHCQSAVISVYRNRQPQVRPSIGRCAAAVREVMGKDGRMKKVRRRVQVDAHATPLAKKVDIQIVDIRYVLRFSLLLLGSLFEPGMRRSMTVAAC